MRFTLLFIVALVLFSFSVITADTINIPADYPTIQEGIDAAVNGDIVLVAAGTYVENINFLGKAITVQSSDGAEATVIDGISPSNPDLGSVVTFNNGEGADSILEGFKLINGSGTQVADSANGGGVFCFNASPTIQSNIISDNVVSGHGGGIYGDAASQPIIENNMVSFNAATGAGGGICCENADSLSISYNTIKENSSGDEGGGIFTGGGADSIIQFNEITDNSANEGGGITCGPTTIFNNRIVGNTAVASAGGIHCSPYSTVYIEYNMIAENEAGVDGGGIFCSGFGRPYIYKNRIINNSCVEDGGGIYVVQPFFSEIVNNMICFNEAQTGGGGGILSVVVLISLDITNNTIFGNSAGTCGGGIHSTVASDPNTIVTNSILWNNSAPEWKEVYNESPATIVDYCDIEDEVWASYPSNFMEDPLFVDSANGDFHLTFDSPCRNTGSNEAPALPEDDFEYDPRDYLNEIDIGADEFYTHFYITGDQTPGGAVQGKLAGLPGTTPVAVFIGSGVRETPVQTIYGDFYLLPPRILIPLIPIPANGVLVVSTTVPLTPPAPYDVPMQGLVGLSSDSLTNLCVLEVR